jgi:hypothetical protein
MEHELALKQLQHHAELGRKDAAQKQEVAYQRDLKSAELEHLEAEDSERLRYLREMQGLQVDLTRYLVAQYQHPDRLIRVDGINGSQLHLHEN